MSGNPQEINRKICEALGLDPNRISALRITCRAGELPAVRVEYVDIADDMVLATLKSYTLEER